jgi:ferric-dicitrate binding protein FerR (iron transport regulator)
VTRSELQVLIGRLLDGTISPDDHALLERVLSEDADARRTYFDAVDLDLGLRRFALVERPAARRSRAPWIAAAAAVLVGLVALATLRRAEPEAPARLAASAGARFFGPVPGHGDPLPPGRDYALVEGRVEIAFSSGARVLLDAPAAFSVRDPLRMTLQFGRGTVQVDERSQGFTVDTPLAPVVDRGTRFSLDVGEGGETEVHVLEGAADLAGVPLQRGDARRMSAQGMSAVPLDPERFPKGIPDGVVAYEATPGSDLIAVTVRRAGTERRYAVEALIGVDAIHYKARAGTANWAATLKGADVPPPGRRHELLDRDRNLNTGLVNPGSAVEPLATDPVMNDPEDPARPNTPGLAVRFQRPVVNAPGPDVVLFEYQPVIQPELGDPFHASPLRFAPGLRTKTVRRWDLTIWSPEALTLSGFRLNSFTATPTSLSAYESAPVKRGVDFNVPSKGLAVTLDLSDLGDAPGAAVEGLFFQDCLDEAPGHQVDFTFIGGLP